MTIPLERALAGMKDVVHIHSVSTAARAILTIDVDRHRDVLAARQDVLTRFPDADLPTNATAALGPNTPADGALVRYAIHGLTPVAARTLEDSTIERALLAVPGVAGVSACGGAADQVTVTVEPDKLGAFAPSDIERAILGEGSDGRVIRPTPVTALRDLVVTPRAAAPAHLSDIGSIARTSGVASCDVIGDADGPTVRATVWLRTGAERDETKHNVVVALDHLKPAGVTFELLDAPLDLSEQWHWVFADTAAAAEPELAKLGNGDAIVERRGFATTQATLIEPDRQALARVNADLDEMYDAAKFALGGVIGEVVDGDRRLAVIVHVPSALADARVIPGVVLKDVAKIHTEIVPTEIFRFDGRRRYGVRFK